MEKEIKPFIPFCKEYLKEQLDEYEGETHYACDLGYILTEGINADGSFTYSRELAKDYLKEWWDEAGDYAEYEKFSFGEYEHNPFENPEAYTVCMVIQGICGLLSKCELIDSNWNDEIELTEDNICRLKDEIDELSDDEEVF